MARVNVALTATIAWWFVPALYALLPYWLLKYGCDLPENEPLIAWLTEKAITVNAR